MSDREALLIDYLLGELSHEQQSALERDLQRDAGLRAELAALSDVTSALAESQAPVNPRADLRGQLVEAMTADRPASVFVTRMIEMFDLTGDAASSLLRTFETVDGPGWEANRIPGMRFRHFAGGPRIPAGVDCGLVYLQPGTPFPRHEHGSDEWSLILLGEIIDDAGQRSLPGDLNHMPVGSAHSFRAGDDGPAAFAVLTELDALNFKRAD